MKNVLRMARWNPYVGGAFLGLVLTVSTLATSMFIEASKYVGVSLTYARITGLIVNLFAPAYVAQSEYFQAIGIAVNWKMMLFFGIFFGALVSSLLGNQFKIERIPALWQQRFGSSEIGWAVMSFIGGLFVILGAQLASGCPTSHGLGGIVQLAISGMIAIGAIFSGSIPVANLIYRWKK